MSQRPFGTLKTEMSQIRPELQVLPRENIRHLVRIKRNTRLKVITVEGGRTSYMIGGA